MQAFKYIASYWTLAGNVVPLGNPEQEASDVGFQDRLEVAAKAGYSGVGLISSDLIKIRKKFSLVEIRSLLKDYGLPYLELEFLTGWMADGRELSDSEKMFTDMLEVADVVGVRHIKVGPDMEGKDWPLERMVERFARLCERGKSVGTMLSLEMMPWSNLNNLESALSVVQGANYDNGGLLLDIWHVARADIPYGAISSIPNGMINHVEINDADREVKGSLLEDTLNHRRFCGDGSFDVPEFLKAVLSQGYKGPFGLEIISEAQRQRSFREVAYDAIKKAKEQVSKI
tara:strand:+ start:1325 stop:2185 length:861 start_codon:yes stop_codon:yes gene_type:complete